MLPPAPMRLKSLLACLVALAVCVALPGSRGFADPPQAAPTASTVTLRGGRVLHGKVVRLTKVDERTFAVVATDFGEIHVPQSEVAMQAPSGAPAETFVAREVRVLRAEGGVEVRRLGTASWVPLSDAITYVGVDRPPPTVKPGDALRTGAAASIDLLLHRDAWVRVCPDSEVEIPSGSAPASLGLLRGTTLHAVTGLPRGATFRVKTPTAVLGVKGTRFLVRASGQEESAAVLEGAVGVEARGDVAAMQQGAWSATGELRRAEISTEARELLAKVPQGPRPSDDMAYVPAGRYLVGAASRGLQGFTRDYSRGSNFVIGYQDAGEVDVAAFLIDRREVTSGDYKAFLAAIQNPPASPSPAWAEDRVPAHLRSFDMAGRYAQWAGKRLPTATQWEVAARGDGRIFPWGSGLSRQPLEMGRWLGPATTLGDGLRWEPPAVLPSVDAPTLDVSPFGVMALVSGVPELVRQGLEQEPIWPLLAPDFQAAHQPGRRVYYRGVRGSVLAIAPLVQPMDVGWRCVIELGAH